MAPLRRRDIRASPSRPDPVLERRIARGLELSIDISLANKPNLIVPPEFVVSTKEPSTDELELALAAKELELVSLLSPMVPGIMTSPMQLTSNISQLPFPEIVDSFQSFEQMKKEFVRYLVNNN